MISEPTIHALFKGSAANTSQFIEIVKALLTRALRATKDETIAQRRSGYTWPS